MQSDIFNSKTNAFLCEQTYPCALTNIGSIRCDSRFGPDWRKSNFVAFLPPSYLVNKRALTSLSSKFTEQISMCPVETLQALTPSDCLENNEASNLRHAVPCDESGGKSNPDVEFAMNQNEDSQVEMLNLLCNRLDEIVQINDQRKVNTCGMRARIS